LGSLGLEPTPALYIEHMVAVFREVRRVMRKDASCWINIGDSYAGASGNNGWRSGDPDNPRNSKQHNRNGLGFVAGIKPKDLLGIPWALAFALREDGWYLRSEIIWAKKAPMPEGVTDRPTSATEKVFLLTKSPRYFYDAEAVKEEASGRAPGNIERAYEHMGGTKAGLANIGPATSRNMRSWWLLGPEPFPEAHFGTYPTEIPRRCIKAGTSERGVCPKCGAPWIRMVDRQLVATRGNVGEDVKHREPMNNDRGQKWGDTNSVYGHYDSQTIGWHPGCLCVGENPNLPAVPATILDPFLGAGTTALVADQLGRNCIGIELNPSYAEMSERRIRADAGMFAEIAVELRPRK
jgi:DNA modification methylase